MIPYGGPGYKPATRPSALPVEPLPERLRTVFLVVLFIASIVIFLNGRGWAAAGTFAAWYAVKKIWKSRYE